MAMMKFGPRDDEELIGYLMKFVCGKPFVECHHIRQIDLYGNKKPCEIFDDSTDVNYFFTKLKRKTVYGKNFNRKIVGGGTWKARDTKKPVHDNKGAVIGFMKTFRFDEDNSDGRIQWTMKEYCINDVVLKELRQRGQIRHKDYVLCQIKKKVKFRSKKFREGENVVANVKDENHNLDYVLSISEDHNQLQESPDLGHAIAATVSSDQLESCVGGENFFVDNLNYQNHDLDYVPSCSSTNGIMKSSVLLEENSVPSDDIQLEKFLNGEEKCSLVSLLTAESSMFDPISQLPLFTEEQFYALMDQEIPSICASSESLNDDDIASYHKELDAYAAAILEESTLPMFHEPIQSFFDKPDPEYPQAYDTKDEANRSNSST